MVEEVKGGSVVPESALKKQKRNEEWSLAKAQDIEEAQKQQSETRKLICKKARLYAKDYEDHESTHLSFLLRALTFSAINFDISNLSSPFGNLDTNRAWPLLTRTW